jgi:hypothetical protein
MYFPYFRGRQYELLALKELVQKDIISNLVMPIIEPIKLMSTFWITMDVYAKANKKIGVVFNPSVGISSKDLSLVDTLLEKLDMDVIIPCVIMNSTGQECLLKLNANGISKTKVIIIMQNRDYLNIYEKLFVDASPLYTLFPDERVRRKVKTNKVIFKDNFNKQARNADYPKDEFFSEDHLYYGEEGYAGFGDYSIIGDEFHENGFAPYAVAIHIVYFDDDKTLRVRHLLSESNKDISDVAGKFYEAISKLVEWRGDDLPTVGITILAAHFRNGTYPGLPSIKKLSIMHHLELMGDFLDSEVEL